MTDEYPGKGHNSSIMMKVPTGEPKQLTLDEFRDLDTDQKLDIIYITQLRLFEYVRDLETKASEMTDPKKLNEMMQNMMGGMFG